MGGILRFQNQETLLEAIEKAGIVDKYVPDLEISYFTGAFVCNHISYTQSENITKGVAYFPLLAFKANELWDSDCALGDKLFFTIFKNFKPIWGIKKKSGLIISEDTELPMEYGLVSELVTFIHALRLHYVEVFDRYIVFTNDEGTISFQINKAAVYHRVAIYTRNFYQYFVSYELQLGEILRFITKINCDDYHLDFENDLLLAVDPFGNELGFLSLNVLDKPDIGVGFSVYVCRSMLSYIFIGAEELKIKYDTIDYSVCVNDTIILKHEKS